MMQKTILSLCLIMLGAVGLTVVSPAGVAYADSCSDKGKLLTLKPWYDGLTDAGNNCALKSPGTSADQQAKYVWRIVLNIVDDIFQVVGYISAGYIIYGGFLMMSADASPDKVAHARKTITYAVVGLVIALSAVAIVNFVISRMGFGVA